MKRSLLLTLTVLSLLADNNAADSIYSARIGNLFISNFSPDMYQAYNQNWDICDDHNGMIYCANGPLLEGSSNHWESYYLGDEKYARSVFRHHDGGILVGANEEFGIFNRKGLPGASQYISLMDRLDEVFHSFGSIWQILEKDSVYYLRAGRGLFKYEKDTVVPMIFGEIVDYMQFIEDELYVLLAQRGLGKMKNNAFNILPYGDYFADIKIVSILPYNDNDFLIFTDDEGVFIADSLDFRPYDQLNIDEIINSQISSVLLLSHNQLAVGTVRNGLYVLDFTGRIINHVNKKGGLLNNTIICMYKDKRHNLWLGLDYGFSYVYLNSCVSILIGGNDIGTGYVSAVYDNKLYLGTNQGLYYMDWSGEQVSNSGEPEILPVNNTSGQVWNLHIINNELYCSHHKGLYKIDGNESFLVSAQEGSWDIQEIRKTPGYYLQSTYRGFFIYRLDQYSNLKLIKKYGGLKDTRIFAQDEQGYIWNVTDGNHIFQYDIDNEELDLKLVKEYKVDVEHDFNRVRIVGKNKQVIFNTEQGFFTFDHSKGTFGELDYYNQLFFKGEVMAEFFEDDYNRIWYVTDKEIGYFSTSFGKMEKISRPFNMVAKSYTRYLGKLNVVDRDNVVFGVDKGFYHFNASCDIMPAKEYRSFIIDLNTAAQPEKDSYWSIRSPHPVYSHKKNSFDFVFSSNIVESQEKIQYSCKLEGYDEQWSAWSDRNSKQYNNLVEGSYTFKVKARDESGIESSETLFSFRIKPPFYRSVFAYILYLVLIAIMVILAMKYRDKKLKQQRERIEEEKQMEIEEKRKKFESEQIKSKQRITELLNERLHQDLKYKSQELSNSMINILHKNEILLNLKKEMQELYLEKNLNKRDYNIKKLINVIDREISTKKDMELFDSNFNAVHEEFLKNLKSQYPELNQNDHRLCTFIKMNKSTKEIATFLNLSIRGVETSRYRLRKKMGLDSDKNLYDIISSI